MVVCRQLAGVALRWLAIFFDFLTPYRFSQKLGFRRVIRADWKVLWKLFQSKLIGCVG